MSIACSAENSGEKLVPHLFNGQLALAFDPFAIETSLLRANVKLLSYNMKEVTLGYRTINKGRLDLGGNGRRFVLFFRGCDGIETAHPERMAAGYASDRHEAAANETISRNRLNCVFAARRVELA